MAASSELYINTKPEKPLNPNAIPFSFSSSKPICCPRSIYLQPPPPPPPPPTPPLPVVAVDLVASYSVCSVYHYNPTPYYYSQYYNAQLQPQPYYKPSSLPYYKDGGCVEEAVVGDDVVVSLENKDCLAGGKEKVNRGVKKEYFPRRSHRKRERLSNNRIAWVPKKSESEQGVKSRVDSKGLEVLLRGKTSVMIRHIPNKLSRKDLLQLLDKFCWVENNEPDWCCDPIRAEYDFVYLPMDFVHRCNLGYAFVNFTSSDAAMRVCKYLQDFKWNSYESKKICKICCANIQGKEALVRHFQNSNFTCHTDDYLPVVLSPPRNGYAPCTAPKIIGRRAASSARKP